jgi:Flavin containing amine oxidoreductase
MSGTIHIIGAGLAGLSAAVRLTALGRKVEVHEATAFAGGRCRSYHDASVGMTIDNGNHLLLSGNHAALDYLRSIGADQRLVGPNSTLPISQAASAGRCGSMTDRYHSGFSILRGACRARVCSIICRWRDSSGRRPGRRSVRSSPAKARSISGWWSR